MAGPLQFYWTCGWEPDRRFSDNRTQENWSVSRKKSTFLETRNYN